MLQRYQDKGKLELTKALKERSLYFTESKGFTFQFPVMPSATLSSNSSSSVVEPNQTHNTNTKGHTPNNFSFKKWYMPNHNTHCWQSNITQKCKDQCQKYPSTLRTHLGMRKKVDWLWSAFLWEDVISEVFAAFLNC